MRPLPSHDPSPVAALVLAAVSAASPAHADVVPQTMNGVPLLPVPTYEEVGLPAFTMPTGTPLLGTDAPGTGTGTGATDPGTATGDGADSTAMQRMLSRPWGELASRYAEQVGVTPVAVAATCTLESQCTADPGGTGTISGAFQMTNATYTAMMASALARNPELAGRIDAGLAGKLNPANQAVAAAEYLREGAVALRNTGYSPNPTVLDVRGYYNFGPTNANAVARAPDDAVMSDLVALTPAQYRANGITPGVTTVGRWRTTVTDRIGASAANAPVLLSPS